MHVNHHFCGSRAKSLSENRIPSGRERTVHLPNEKPQNATIADLIFHTGVPPLSKMQRKRNPFVILLYHQIFNLSIVLIYAPSNIL